MQRSRDLRERPKLGLLRHEQCKRALRHRARRHRESPAISRRFDARFEEPGPTFPQGARHFLSAEFQSNRGIEEISPSPRNTRASMRCRLTRRHTGRVKESSLAFASNLSASEGKKEARFAVSSVFGPNKKRIIAFNDHPNNSESSKDRYGAVI